MKKTVFCKTGQDFSLNQLLQKKTKKKLCASKFSYLSLNCLINFDINASRRKKQQKELLKILFTRAVLKDLKYISYFIYKESPSKVINYIPNFCSKI